MTNYLGNTALRWTSTFFRSLLKYGVKHIIISPGSRSTPLTLAVACNPNFTSHVILDERSAAFTALGIGKATNTPAVLICTSGTALANYYPAVIEARQSGIPIILATADRPPNLRSTGANQAIDQLNIFGDYPVLFHEVGEPRTEKEDLERLKMLAGQAVSVSQKKRGPVHLNFAFRKPLEPQPDFLQETIQSNNGADEIIDTSGFETSTPLSGQLPQQIRKSQKPLIVLGPLAPTDDVSSIAKLAEYLNAPVLSESTIDSPNTIRGFSAFLRNKTVLDNLEPDLIIRFGFQPTTKGLELGLKKWNPNQHYHFASTDTWQDATYSGAEHISWKGKPIECLESTASTEQKWLKKWQKTAQNFYAHYEKKMADSGALTDGAVYHRLTPQISTDIFICTSNSFSARDIHLFGQQSSEVLLYQNRGTSGIDGTASTAIGLSLALEKPGVLFTGDLAFFHDTNALLNARKLSHPLSIIIINNCGGSIFRMLPIQQYDEYFKHYFETPQSVDINSLAKSYDIPYRQIDNPKKLKELHLADWMNTHNGLSIIECRTDAEASMQLRQKIWGF